MAGELHKAVAMAISKGVAMRDAMAESLRLPLLMLQALQPEAFGHFDAFVAWQQTVCDMLVTLYSNAANQWQALEGGMRPSKQARHLLARCVCWHVIGRAPGKKVNVLFDCVVMPRAIRTHMYTLWIECHIHTKPSNRHDTCCLAMPTLMMEPRTCWCRLYSVTHLVFCCHPPSIFMPLIPFRPHCCIFVSLHTAPHAGCVRVFVGCRSGKRLSMTGMSMRTPQKRSPLAPTTLPTPLGASSRNYCCCCCVDAPSALDGARDAATIV